MAKTKLDTKTVKRLTEIGITETTEEDARKKLLAILAKNDVNGVDDEPILQLIDIASVFIGEDNTEEEPEEEEEEEVVEDNDDEEEELPASTKNKKGSGKKVNITAEDVDDLASEVSKNKPAKSAPKKSAPKKSAPKAERKRLEGERWENLTPEQKKQAIAPLVKLLPLTKFKFEMLLKSFTVKLLGDSSEQNIFKFHLLRLLNNKKLEGVFVSHRCKTIEELEKYLPEAAKDGRTIKLGDSCSYLHPFNIDEIVYMLTKTDFLKMSIESAKKQDTKMKLNREKFESTIVTSDDDKPSASAANKGAKKPTVIIEAENDDEDEEEEMPVVKAKGNTNVAAKKSTPVPTAKKPAAKKK